MTVNDADVDYAVDLLAARHVLSTYIRLLHWVLAHDVAQEPELTTNDFVQRLHDHILLIDDINETPHLSNFVRLMTDQELENMLDAIISMGAETYVMNSIRGRNLKSHVHRIWRELEELGDK